jgi:hypothetical protein
MAAVTLEKNETMTNGELLSKQIGRNNKHLEFSRNYITEEGKTLIINEVLSFR